MQTISRVLGVVVAALGLFLAGWAPVVFASLSGHALPAPVASSETAMSVWSGVAFARVFGALVFAVGAVLWASTAPVAKARSIHVALLAGFAFATLMVWSQQVAIWANAVGWSLVGLFGVLTLLTAVTLVRSDVRELA
jgi:hypothetical protein